MIRRLVRAVIRRLGFDLVKPDDIPAIRRLEDRVNQTDANVAFLVREHDALAHSTAHYFSAACMEQPGTPLGCYSCVKHAQRCQCKARCSSIVPKPQRLCGACEARGCVAA